MGITYNIYDLFLKGEVLQSFQCTFSNGVNSGMMLIGALNLFLFGFSRFSLLLPNFLRFFLCEIIGAKSIMRITGRSYCALIYYGLLLMTQAVFVAVGRIFDYRWDFLAFCVYSIWLIYLLVCSHEYEETKTSMGGAKRLEEIICLLQKYSGKRKPLGIVSYRASTL